MSHDHHFQMNGRRWLWRFTRLRGDAVGWTFMRDPKNQSVKERVLIDERLKGKPLLETVIHEALHALNPTQSEEHVTQQAADIARILWFLGYRRPDGPPLPPAGACNK